MRKFNKYFTLPCAAALLMASCTDLEENLRGDITEDINVKGITTNTDGGTDDGLNAAFGELRGSGTAFHSSFYSLQEITSDEMCIAAKGGDWFDGGILIDLHKHTYKPTHDFVNNAWTGTYNAIGTANEKINSSTSSPAVKAQARALRAYFYMRLLDMFGRVKLITEAGVDKPQSTRAEVYNFVESELLAVLGVPAITAGMDLSASNLGTAKNAYRINIYGALGILSKLYLNSEVYNGTKNYDKAEIAASYIIDNGPYTLCGTGCKVANLGKRPAVASDPDNLEGYAAVFAANNENNPEHIFSVFYDEVTGGGMNFAQMNLHYSSQFTYNFQDQPWNGYATLEEFYNSYEDGDLRKKNNFLVGPQFDFGGNAILDYASDDDELPLSYTPKINELQPNSQREAGARPAKFSYKQFGRPDMDNDFPIIRLGDVYLMRGEAKARNNANWADAKADVDIVRARAGVAPMATVTAESFLAERGREMFQEASRRTDLIRFGKYNGTWWEKAASPAFVNVFPIPQKQIETAGSGLSQNDGY